MKKLLGLLLCMASLVLLHRNLVGIGLPVFVFGIMLMYEFRWPRR
jgi:hypothetical protein